MPAELPTPLYIFTEQGVQIKIVGAAKETRKPIIVYDKEMYRDRPTPVVGGAAIGDPATGNSVSIAGGVDPTTTTTSGTSITAKGASSVLQEDDYTHVPKRYIPKLDTLIEFWDGELVGEAMTISVTTTMSSGVITVPSAQLLTPGQGISGVGIPAGTVILSILSQANGLISSTTATMSQVATAAGTVAAILTGSNKVGEVLQSEFVSWGSEISTPI